MKTAAISIKRVIRDKKRFEGEFYLNNNSLLSMIIEDLPYCTYLASKAEVFNPPVFKRQFCNKTQKSIPYFQSSDVQNASEYGEVFIFGPQAIKLNLTVNEGDILVTGFGTIGNTRLVNRCQHGVSYANNVCRIRSHQNEYKGYIYAFLSSKYGKALLNKNASGSVVRYIEAPGIKKTLIPVFPIEFQERVDAMIKESSRLREEAAEALGKAKGFFEEHLQLDCETESTKSVSIKSVISSQNKRFEANYYGSLGASYEEYILENFDTKPLSFFYNSISRPDLFKRSYVSNESGLMFFGSSELFMATPQSSKFVSKKTPNLESLILEEGWVLLPRSGTIGDVAYATSQHAQKLASEDVIRLKPDNILRGAYAYAFLSSFVGKCILQKAVFGSVIQHIEPPMLNIIPVPIFKDSFDEIANLVISGNKKLGQAGDLELEAIAMVEAEIEKWSKE